MSGHQVAIINHRGNVAKGDILGPRLAFAPARRRIATSVLPTHPRLYLCESKAFVDILFLPPTRLSAHPFE